MRILRRRASDQQPGNDTPPQQVEPSFAWPVYCSNWFAAAVRSLLPLELGHLSLLVYPHHLRGGQLLERDGVLDKEGAGLVHARPLGTAILTQPHDVPQVRSQTHPP